ncbi:HIRAN domain-containing protein [Sediminicurvatus halobius]|uniref:HIRAN domain-containing protein n=1 Tax=Sediminicurvatus halobius TaxID=2182432 RepID=A0A2U2MZV7_9GAMM|nr:HIRAN domain-containing protein [Spiribacter halobius]PWG62323.1 hypothetical protein DEM34_12680 [Spiribacter halobius]UEX79756.1 HIRAN domain-containing protein [Spiribacter halobius]
MGNYSSYIAGIINKQRRKAASRLTSGSQLVAKREPDNPVDPNAVALYLGDHTMVGYIPARHASWLAERMDKGRSVFVQVKDVRLEGFFWNRRVFVDVTIKTGVDAE